MSHAEITAHKLYDTMHLDSVSDDVKRHLMILILSGNHDAKANDDVQAMAIPQSLEETMSMGAVDLETARKELHTYVDGLAKEYNLQ